MPIFLSAPRHVCFSRRSLLSISLQLWTWRRCYLLWYVILIFGHLYLVDHRVFIPFSTTAYRSVYCSVLFWFEYWPLIASWLHDSESSCDEAEWTFTYPGDATGGLGTSDPWNDRITNFMCYGNWMNIRSAWYHSIPSIYLVHPFSKLNGLVAAIGPVKSEVLVRILRQDSFVWWKAIRITIGIGYRGTSLIYLWLAWTRIEVFPWIIRVIWKTQARRPWGARDQI